MLFLNKVKKGYQPDYQYILALISYINMPVSIDEEDFIKQRLLNYGDTDYLHLGR